jgi:iron complex outermembrane receptor protein
MFHVRQKRLLLCASLVFAIMAIHAVRAQELVLSGVVRDATGVVPGATVAVVSGGRQVAATTTDAQGRYRFDTLAPGSVQVTFTMRGYEPAVRNVTVGPDMPAVDALLAVGRVSTTLAVTATVGKATATRLPVSNDEVPAQVSGIPQELLQQQGVNTVADALRNASGVQAFRWYGAYEQYTIRGFNDDDRDGFNVVLVDGMRFGGNRYGTQTGNVQSIEVLKGPSSVLYGRGAVGGVINVVRKQPQAVPAYAFGYRVGRFNTHQLSGGATGALDAGSRLLYRVDVSVERSDGWRRAGATRFNLSPSLTWLIGDRSRLSVYQAFNRDRFDGDGGVPLNIVDRPDFRGDLRFNLPQDSVLVEDSQTQVVFDSRLSPSWEIRHALQVQRTSDRYFVTEGIYGDPEHNQVFREPLDFHHVRRPVQAQIETVGRVNRFGRHQLLAGYEFQRDKYRTDVTAGDDPDCLCGYWWTTIAPMDIGTLEETQTPFDTTAVERQTFVTDRVHAVYAQDQIEVRPYLKLNLGLRVDDYHRTVTRVGGLPFTPQRRDQTAVTYRAGAVFAPRFDQQVYAVTASSLTPVTTVPEDGSQLEPSLARSVEVGHRWSGLDGRIDANAAVYYIVRNHVTLRDAPTSVRQIGEQRSAGLDLDVNADLGLGAYVLFNYGLTKPRFENADDLSGLVPRYVPRHTANIWVRKDWSSGLNGAFGLRIVGGQFADDANARRLDGYSIASAAVGYRSGRWEWSLNVDNLFNNDDYFLPGHFSNLAFPGPPISMTTAIQVRY